MYPGLIDTDSVKDPGVGARMIYSTVLPQDEQEFFGVWPSVANTPEQKIIEVSHLHRVYPISNTILITAFLMYLRGPGSSRAGHLQCHWQGLPSSG